MAAYALVAGGCGVSRTSNTARTATEQLLISDAIDRTVDTIDFSVFRGEAVFFDERHLLETVDKGYLISSFRQHLLASGAVLKDARDQATYVIEPRVGAVGTDSNDLLFGIPAVNVPQVAMAPTLPAAIPEIPFAKRRDQQATAKLAVFAYRRETGEPVWQSGIVENRSTANDIWVLGAGPFQRGTIYDGTRFIGKTPKPKEGDDDDHPHVAKLEDAALFATIKTPTAVKTDAVKTDAAVAQASAETPVTPAAPAVPPVPPVDKCIADTAATAAVSVAPPAEAGAPAESAPPSPPSRHISEAPVTGG